MTATPTHLVVAFSGSLRHGSSNTALLHLARRVAPDDLRVQLVDWVDQLPYYNPDLEANLPQVASTWRELVHTADAIVIGMPEYNWGPTAVAKNAIDWLTRPAGQHALRDKVIAIVTSGGKSGGSKVHDAVAPILQLLGNVVVDEPRVQIALGSTRIAADGQTDDQEIIELMTAKMANLASALAARD